MIAVIAYHEFCPDIYRRYSGSASCNLNEHYPPKQKIKMKKTPHLFQSPALLILVFSICISCSNSHDVAAKEMKVDSVAANIKMYTHVWNEIINKEGWTCSTIAALQQMQSCTQTPTCKKPI